MTTIREGQKWITKGGFEVVIEKADEGNEAIGFPWKAQHTALRPASVLTRHGQSPGPGRAFTLDELIEDVGDSPADASSPDIAEIAYANGTPGAITTSQGSAIGDDGDTIDEASTICPRCDTRWWSPPHDECPTCAESGDRLNRTLADDMAALRPAVTGKTLNAAELSYAIQDTALLVRSGYPLRRHLEALLAEQLAEQLRRATGDHS